MLGNLIYLKDTPIKRKKKFSGLEGEKYRSCWV